MQNHKGICFWVEVSTFECLKKMKQKNNVSMSSLIKELVLEGLKVKAFQTRDKIYQNLLSEMKTEIKNKSNPVETRIAKILDINSSIMDLRKIEE